MKQRKEFQFKHSFGIRHTPTQLHTNLITIEKEFREVFVVGVKEDFLTREL